MEDGKNIQRSTGNARGTGSKGQGVPLILTFSPNGGEGTGNGTKEETFNATTFNIQYPRNENAASLRRLLQMNL